MDHDRTATYAKMMAMKDAIAHLRVRDKRAVFLLMRTASDQLNVDTFFPLQGFTAGEFAVGQVLADNNRKPSAGASAPTRADSAVPPPPPPTQPKAARSKATKSVAAAKSNKRLATVRQKALA